MVKNANQFFNYSFCRRRRRRRRCCCCRYFASFSFETLYLIYNSQQSKLLKLDN
jgi:hypothetical protein